MKFLLLVVLVGVAVYLVVRGVERRRQVDPGTRPPGSGAPRRPRGPDDDPDFLRSLGDDKR